MTITPKDIHSFEIFECGGGEERKCMHSVLITRIDGQKSSIGTLMREDVQCLMRSLAPVKITCHPGIWHFSDKPRDEPAHDVLDLLNNKLFKHNQVIDRLMTLSDDELKQTEMTDEERQQLMVKKADGLFLAAMAENTLNFEHLAFLQHSIITAMGANF